VFVKKITDFSILYYRKHTELLVLLQLSYGMMSDGVTSYENLKLRNHTKILKAISQRGFKADGRWG